MRRLNESLQESIKRFTDIAKVSTDWIWESDENHILTYVSDRFCEVTGVPAKMILGRTRREFGRKSEADWDFYDRTLAEQKPFQDFNYSTYYAETDQRRYWQISGTPVFDAKGVFRGYRGTGRERTAEVENRKAIERSEAQFRSLIEGSIQGVYIHRDSTFLFANQALADIFGYGSPEEILELGTPVPLYSPDEHDRLRVYKEARKKGEYAPETYEVRGVRKDGSPMWAECRVTMVEWQDEAAMQCVIVDITSRKEAEEALIRHRDHLQDLVDKATAEIKAKAAALETALDKEKKLNELQRQFVSMASHEFRTPLAIIDVGAQRLSRKVADDGVDAEYAIKKCKQMRDAVARMSRLMESTLSLTRMDEGKVSVEFAPCDIAAVLRRVCDNQQELADAHRIVAEIGTLPPHIKADECAIEQVLTNLLSNAIKYAPDNPEIALRADCQDGQVVVSVSDNGLGIDPEDMPEVFTRYFRAKTSAGIAGTGIGLYMVKTLVEMHGGAVCVESRKGQGSTFTVRLPVAGPQAGHVPQKDAAAA